MVSTARGKGWLTIGAAILLGLCAASTAAAQPAGRNEGRITISAGLDFANAYMFRGIRQDDTRVIIWPYVDAGVDLYDGDGGLDSVTINIGTWNSLHTGTTGLDAPAGNGELWYESDVYGTIGFGFAGGVTVGATYTAYTSPNNAFTTVQELAFKATFDDAGLTGLAVNPHALLAFELDTAPGIGQADGGLSPGTYLELGVTPRWDDPAANIAFPIKVGLSLDDYYELAGVDNTFGYLSLAAVATVPLGGTTSYGAWNVHGGIEFLSLGDTPEAFNGGDQSKLVASIGIGLSY